jgi:hypothetical protein
MHPSGGSWSYLRVAHFDNRPGHADQLHLDLWWRDLNIAQDAGTYLYNASPPWENALTHTAVHNTVTVNGLEQMTRASRFLYLDRAQAILVGFEESPDGSERRVTALHDGYRQIGLNHQRTVIALAAGGWMVKDYVQPLRHQPISSLLDIRLHWLLPDWSYEILAKGCGLRIRSPFGWITLEVMVSGGNPDLDPQPELTISRCGKVCHGSGPTHPTWGWISPTYGNKQPALSTGFYLKAQPPVTLVTHWSLPDVEIFHP